MAYYHDAVVDIIRFDEHISSKRVYHQPQAVFAFAMMIYTPTPGFVGFVVTEACKCLYIYISICYNDTGIMHCGNHYMTVSDTNQTAKADKGFTVTTVMTQKLRFSLREYILIALGSILYAVSTVLFVFPSGLLLGGTSGISVILTRALPLSPGVISMILNFTLIILAFAVLGKGMASKTMIGSVLTAAFIGLLDELIPLDQALIENPYISSIVGAMIIAAASGILFFVDSSSGGTDIIALIVRKFSGIQIGRALLITDVLIVLVGGFMAGTTILISSFLGLLIKTLGIDVVIWIIKRIRSYRILNDISNEEDIRRT